MTHYDPPGDIRRLRTFAVALFFAAAIFVACDHPRPFGEPDAQNTTVWDESRIVAHLGLEASETDTSYVYTAGNGLECGVAVVLTSASMVELYEGDVVATNPGGTAGVKIVAAEAATCRVTITEHLASLQ